MIKKLCSENYNYIFNTKNGYFARWGKTYEDDPKEEIRNIAGEMGLFTHYEQDGNGVYIGRKWSNIKDDETGAEFKKSVKDKISLLVLKIPVKDATLATFEEGWYDG